MMFQAATSKGQKVSLFLESRGKETFATFKYSSLIGLPIKKQQKKKPLNPSQLRRSQARMKLFIEKKEKEKQMVEKTTVPVVPGPCQSAESADCSHGRDGQLILQLDVGGGGEPVDGVVTADIPQLDGEAAAVKETEELVKLVFKFDHEKGRGDKETLKNKLRETNARDVVKDIFVNQKEDKRSAYGKKFNIFVTTLTILKGKEKEVQWPRTVNGFLDVTLLGEL